MKSMMNVWILLGVLIASDVNAAPAKPLQICVASNGAMTVKAKCGGKESKLTTNLLNRIMAPAVGPQGPAGPSGMVDPARCRTQINSSSGYNYSYVVADCGPGEFLMTHGVYTDTVQNDVISIALRYNVGESFPSGVAYETGVNGGTRDVFYTATTAAVCCSR